MIRRALPRGYTLLEMIVSVGIFSIIMLTATGAFLTLVKLDREARLTNDLTTNLSFAVDSMARSIRTGTAYKCNNSAGTPNCTTFGSSFGFTDANGRQVVYDRTGTQIRATINGTSYLLTDPRINIQSLNFYVRGVGTSESCGSRAEPQVTFTVYGTMTTAQNTVVDFTIQGSATQRVLELASTVCP